MTTLAASGGKRHKHVCSRTKVFHTPCRCHCGAERRIEGGYGKEVPRGGGRWRKKEEKAAG